MKYLFDTSTYSHLLKGHITVADAVHRAESLLLPQVVVAELRYGFRLGSRTAENDQLLTKFLANKKVRILLPDNATTDYFVNVAVFARRKGVQLSTHDLWIAALALQWDATLLSFDKDFEHLGYADLQLQLERDRDN